MKRIILFPALFFTLAAGAQSPKAFDYTLIFGSCFQDDVVSLTINNRTVLTNIKLQNRDAIIRGNLSLVQDEAGIRLNYNGVEQVKKSISFDFTLKIRLDINGQRIEKLLDLRKGNIILVDYCNTSAEGNSTRKLTTEQLQEPFLFM